MVQTDIAGDAISQNMFNSFHCGSTGVTEFKDVHTSVLEKIIGLDFIMPTKPKEIDDFFWYFNSPNPISINVLIGIKRN